MAPRVLSKSVLVVCFRAVMVAAVVSASFRNLYLGDQVKGHALGNAP